MSEEKYNVGVFGIGWVAGEHIKAYVNNPLTRVVALASRRRQSAQAKKDDLHLDCDILDSLDEMLTRDDIDIISLCSPNFLRADEIIKCCQAGKHFFAEKPIVHTLEQLRAVEEAYASAQVKSIVGFVVEYYAQFLSIRSLITTGGLGDIFYVETDYWHELGPAWTGWSWANTIQGGGSTALLGGCHAVAAMMSLIEDDVAEVMAYQTRGHRQDFEYAPTYTALVKFRHGAIGRTGGSFEVESPYVFNIIVHGSEGSVYNDTYYSKRLFAGQEDFQSLNCTLINSGDVAHHPFQAVVNALVEDLEKDLDSRIRLEFGLKVHEVILAIDRSAQSGKPVRLPLGFV